VWKTGFRFTNSNNDPETCSECQSVTVNFSPSANEEYPRVSVITAAYNRASLLDETIQSVLNQDYPNLEYIVLDDGSTDATLEVIKKYEGRILWTSHSNMGETRTVNKGFSMATGEIVGVVSSDDPLLPGAIRELARKLVAEPELLVVYPDWDMIDENGEFLKNEQTQDYDYIEMVRHWHCLPGPAAFFRHSVATRLEGRDPGFRFVGDFDFWLRAGLMGPFARVPRTLANFRQHPDGATSKDQGESMAREHVRLVKKIFSLPNLPREVRDVKREAFSGAYFLAGLVCVGDSVRLRKRFYRLAFLYSPSKYFREHRYRLDLMLPYIVPKSLQLLYGYLVRARNSFNFRRKKLWASLRSRRKHSGERR
jgi:glycosyltransferase involved in cell wall biosynthesis